LKCITTIQENKYTPSERGGGTVPPISVCACSSLTPQLTLTQIPRVTDSPLTDTFFAPNAAPIVCWQMWKEGGEEGKWREGWMEGWMEGKEGGGGGRGWREGGRGGRGGRGEEEGMKGEKERYSVSSVTISHLLSCGRPP